MRVADLMQKDVRTIGPDATVAELVQAMADSRVSGLPVVTSSGRVIASSGPPLHTTGTTSRAGSRVTRLARVATAAVSPRDADHVPARFAAFAAFRASASSSRITCSERSYSPSPKW